MNEKILTENTHQEPEKVVELTDEQLDYATGGTGGEMHGITYNAGECKPDVYCPACKQRTMLKCVSPTKVTKLASGATKYETTWICIKCRHIETTSSIE